MKARAVIGANWGDEGKGLMTDYLCSKGAGVVVRFNGGAQAGHTVCTPDGKRHVFGHLGSGTFLGVPTFLSQYFVVNPIIFAREMSEYLATGGTVPQVYAHPDCLVTTFADMIINQRLEKKRGKDRHGSVGLGVGETVERSLIPSLKITMSDLWNRSASVETKIAEICDKYARFRTGEPITDKKMIEAFIKGCWKAAEAISPAGIGQCKDPVFEGAQGLLLDQNNKAMFPHVTRSNTGMANVFALCKQAGITDMDIVYVSRTYLTKHGAGPLPGEDPKMSFPDDTNTEHPWQGKLRFAPLDAEALVKRCAADANGHAFGIALTHCDQLAPPADLAALYESHGPTRTDVRHGRNVASKADMRRRA
jgi:adenylosuccinate synthase